MSWEAGIQESRNRFPDINKEILEMDGYLEEEEAKLLLYKFLRQNPSFAAEFITGVKLFPFQHMSIKAMMETDYFLGIWSRGMSKSFSTAVFALLDAILNQGVHIGIISKSFRQSKMIFTKMEEIAQSPKAEFLSQCITRVSKANDQWVMELGRSKITALPLGDGEKLRGFRFERMIIDELLLMPEKVLNEVIMPFLSVIKNPTERQEIHDVETEMIKQGPS
jgi:phage terminase large subunit-like protein